MDKYILLADPDPEILHFELTALKYFYVSKVETASNAEQVLEILKSKGRPELMLLDLEILKARNSLINQYLEEQKFILPVIISTDSPDANSVMKESLSVNGILEKPLSVDSFTYLVKSLIITPPQSPSHVPIDIKIVLDLACKDFDLFLKLSGTNFVKIVSKDDVFSYLDAQKLMDKGVRDLHILSSDAYRLLRSWEKGLLSPATPGRQDLTSSIVLAIETLENIERVARAMNWSKDILISAESTISAAIDILAKNEELKGALKKRFSNRTSSYNRHIGLLCFLCCAFSSTLKWTGDSKQLKLVMAALLHDLEVDEKYYENIKEWNSRARDLKDKSPEVVKYRLHPVHASRLVQSIDSIPPDVDQIILQHHEVKDGSGFPRSLTSSRIGQLATLFIMMEDLVEFIGDGENVETSLIDFITWGQAFYDQGHFAKIFEQIRDKVKAG